MNYPQESGIRHFRENPKQPSSLAPIIDFYSLKENVDGRGQCSQDMEIELTSDGRHYLLSKSTGSVESLLKSSQSL